MSRMLVPKGTKVAKKKVLRPLTEVEKAFVDVYMSNGMNATRAYLEAYDSTSVHSASRKGSALTHREVVRKEIDRRIKLQQMTKDEALLRHAIQGRGDVGDMLVDSEVVCPNCRKIIHKEGIMRPDLKRAKELGLTHLIKKVTTSTDGRNQTVEFYASDEARRDILRAHGAFQTKAEEAVGGLADLLSAALQKRAEDADGES